MARDPGDRYPGARALAGDVERWMADEPVEAYRDPPTVRVARWARRHRTLVSSAAVLLVSVVAALSISTGLIWAEQRRTAEAKRAADGQRDRAEAEKSRAERNFELAWGMSADLA